MFDLCSDPDVQEKVRRCVKQGFIDPEDFKGVCSSNCHKPDGDPADWRDEGS